MSTVQHFRQTKELSTVVMENLKKSQKEADKLTVRNIYCPYCGYLVERVFSDISGHKLVYCKKCKAEYIITFGYFRRQRYFNYFKAFTSKKHRKIYFPDKRRMKR